MLLDKEHWKNTDQSSSQHTESSSWALPTKVAVVFISAN
jgi:hypothetical protein